MFRLTGFVQWNEQKDHLQSWVPPPPIHWSTIKIQNTGTSETITVILKWAASWQNQQCGCAPSEDSDQPGHPPRLIRVFAVRMKKAWVLSYPLSPQRRLWSDWTNAQADLSLRWSHNHFVGFVMRRLKCEQYGFTNTDYTVIHLNDAEVMANSVGLAPTLKIDWLAVNWPIHNPNRNIFTDHSSKKSFLLLLPLNNVFSHWKQIKIVPTSHPGLVNSKQWYF